MRFSNINILYTCLVSLLIGCSPEQSKNSKNESSRHLVSDSYKAPVFVNDNRIEQIKKISPELRNLIINHAEIKNIPGIAYGIVVDNELVVASATGFIDMDKKLAATTKSAFRIASMTKSFTAMAIMKLRDEGKLSLNDPVSQYIPEMSTVGYLTDDSPVIDIENLLTMTAGFPEDNPWGDRQLHESNQMLMDLIADEVSFSNTPSYRFEYSNTGYALLGNIVSRVSGIPYQAYIKANILQPLGMEQTYWEYDSVPNEQLAIGYRWEDEQWKLEPMLHDGAYGAMGGLITSIEDFSKYVSFHLSAWPPRSDEDAGPVKRGTLREMHTPQFAKLYADATDFNGDPCAVISGYGYGLGITKYCNNIKRISHGGALPGFGSNYVFFPEYGVGIMAFCNLTYTSPYPFKDIGKLLFDSLDLQPRQLPVSDILAERQKQIVELIQSWDLELETNILAENFYMDKSRAHRMSEIQDVINKAGDIQKTNEMEPRNQLRGSFKIQAENGVINIFFTLSPEKHPKVQQLDISFDPNEKK
ncbi:MAG: CubicO group peptidase (beta-lactamase class C family) [Cyclobacteriaceae bacterium]|jgi:CubicO group peptidase (beta-lactamase class C family)